MVRSTAESLFAEYVRRGDHEAFNQVVELTWEPLFRFALYRTRNASDAEDLVQATYLGAIESGAQFDPDRDLESWLVGILHNRVRALWRETRRDVDPRSLPTPESPEPADEAHVRQLNLDLAQSIETLQEPYREITRLHLLEGLTATEIAERLGRPTSTVRTQLQRSLPRMRRAFRHAISAGLLGLVGARELSASVLRQAPGTAGPGDGSSPAAESALPKAAWSARLTLVGVLAVATAAVGWIANDDGEVHADPVSTSIATVEGPARIAEPEARDELRRSEVELREAEQPAASASIELVVIDADADQPLGGAPLFLVNSLPSDGSVFDALDRGELIAARTDAEGRLSHPCVPGKTIRAAFGEIHGVMCPKELVAERDAEPVEIPVRRVMRLHGVVTDQDSKPVVEARLWISARAGQTLPGFPIGTTVEDGSFDIPVPFLRHRPGMALWVEAPGFATSGLQLLQTDAAQTKIDLVLEPSERQIVVTAADAEGRALSDFSASIYRGGQGCDRFPACHRRAADGEPIEFSGLLPGPYAIILRHAGYAPSLWTIEIGDEPCRVEETLHLSEGGTVRGRVDVDLIGCSTRQCIVRAMPAGLRLEAPHVWSRLMQRCEIGGDGTFVLRDVSCGQVQISVSPSNGLPAISEVVTIEAGRELLWNPLVEPLGSLRGTVRFADGRAVPSIKVGVGAAGIASKFFPIQFDIAETDGEGRFQIEGFDYDRFDLWVFDDRDRFTRSFPLLIRPDISAATRELDIVLPQDLRPRTSISGKVSTAETLQGCELLLYNVDADQADSFPIQPDGSFSLGPFPAGEYDLAVRHPEAGTRWYQRVSLGGTAQLDVGSLFFGEGAGIRFDISTAAGVAPGFIRMRSAFPFDEQFLLPNDDGRIGPVSQLTPGTWTVSVFGERSAPVQFEVFLQEGSTEEVELRLEPARCCMLSFDISRSWNHASGSMRVTITDAEGLELFDEYSPATAADRPLSLGLTPGMYRIEVRSTWGGYAERFFEVPAEGDGDLLIEIEVL